MDDKPLMRATKAAMAATGVGVLDIEFVRITPETDVSSLERFTAAGAELGAKYMITSAYDPDLSRFTDRLAAVSDLASQYGLRAVLEFFPWTVVPDLGSAVRIVEAAERPALGILVDTLHFNRSASTFDDLDRISASRLPFVHVADAPVQASYTTEELLARWPRGAPAARRGRHRYQAHPESYASGHPGGAGSSNDRHGRGGRRRGGCASRASGGGASVHGLSGAECGC